MTPERKKLVRILVLVAVTDLLIAAVGVFIWFRYYHPRAALPDDTERAELAARMLNLSAAAEGYFAQLDAAPTGTEAEVVRRVAEHDLRLLNKLDTYRLRIQYQQKHALLLLCTKDGTQALLEDAGCTAQMDRHPPTNAPCEFTLKAEAVCGPSSPATP